MPIKVLDDTGQRRVVNLICAIDYLTGLETDGEPDKRRPGREHEPRRHRLDRELHRGGIREAICNSVAAGDHYVAAAGNSTVDTSTFIPAAFPEVISGLRDDRPRRRAGRPWRLLLFFFYCDDTLAEFSNYGVDRRRHRPRFPDHLDWTGGGYR